MAVDQSDTDILAKVDQRTLLALLGKGALSVGSGTHMYYRQPNGDITTGYTDQMSLLRAFEEGWLPLHDYGRFNMNDYYLENPYEVLFVRGGAIELTVRQIEELGLHTRPPLVPTCGFVVGFLDLSGKAHRHSRPCWNDAKPVAFPQNEHPTIEDVRCPFCTGEFLTTAAKDQHLSLMHADRVQNHRFQEAMVGAISSIGAAQPAQTAMVPRAQPIGGDYVCGRCGEDFTSWGALSKHVKAHRTATGVVAAPTGDISSSS